MQRYRVNYRLLIGLVAGFVVAAPAIYFLWSFQVDRNATRLLQEAQYSEEKGDHEEAFDSLSQYVKLRMDDATGFLRLGQSAVELSKKDDATMEMRSKAYFALVEAVLRTGGSQVEWTGSAAEQAAKHEESLELSRSLVELHMRYGYMDRALTVIDSLIKNGHEDAKLDALKAQCLFASQDTGDAARWSYEILGYNQQTKEFDQKARAADQPVVYAMLARYLMGVNQEDVAARAIAQMVTANPESREAYIYQYQLLKVLDKDEEARGALEAAFKIDPNDAAVIEAKGQEEIADYTTAMEKSNEEGADRDALRKEAEDHLVAAGKFFTQGLEKYPEHIGFYELAARIEVYRRNQDEALAIIERGLKNFKMDEALSAINMPLAVDLQGQKIDILFERKDIPGVQREIKALRDLNNPRVLPLADYYEARILLYNGNWLEAARRFNDVKTRLVGAAGLQALASAYQGHCHEQLGQLDLARDAYDWALGKNPALFIAQVGLQQVNQQLGKDDGNVVQFDQIVQKTLELPPAQQDWNQVEQQMTEYVRQQAEMQGRTQTWIECRQELLRAQMYVSRALALTDKDAQQAMVDKAKDAVRHAHELDPNDLNVQLAVPRIFMIEPKNGPAVALKALDAMVAKNKQKGVAETLPFRLLRIDILFALHDDQVANQLRASTEGLEDFSPDQQAQVWAAVAGRFEQLGNLPDAELFLKQAAELAPTMLTYRVALFELARKQADDAAMREAQKGILEIVKSETAPDYVLTEVRRLMVAYATGLIGKDELKNARTKLNDAIKVRSTWAELYVLSAQLYLLLEQDTTQAVASLNKALENGPNNANALNLQIRLLHDLGRYADARKIMDRLPQPSWTPVLERVAANVLRNVGEMDKAFAEAKKLADANPKDPATLVWFGEIANAAKKYNEAEVALKAAIALNPSDPDLWSQLLNFYMFRNMGDEVELTLRQAELALDEEYTTLLIGQQHRLFQRFAQAEGIFLAAYRDELDDLRVNQRLAEFYLGWGEKEPAYRDKAAPYLNHILRAVYEGKVAPTDPNVVYARRQGARVLSLSGDYQDSLKAEKLLAASVANDAATSEGEDMLVDILTRRGDPASRERAIKLLRDIQKRRGLQPQYELQLGQALAETGQWTECLQQMQDAITRYPDNLSLRVGLIEMLIDRKDATAAESWLSRLGDIKGGPEAAIQLRIRLAAAQGDTASVRKQLEALTPRGAALTEKQLQVIYAASLLAEVAGDHEYALKLMTEISPHMPGHELELARLTALYGDLDTGMKMLQALFETQTDDVLNTAVEVLTARRDEAPEKLDEFINLLVRQARRADPEAAKRMVLEAETLQIQQKFPEAVESYNQMLARDDVPKFVRASALNNLAFLLAMLKQDLDRALASANEAMDIIGPISDILDTRALVYIHRNEPKEAVKDLQMAVKAGATASKYFHLAEALLAAGDEPGAIAAWDQAKSKGISPDKVPLVEREDLEKLMQKLESLQTNAQAGG